MRILGDRLHRNESLWQAWIFILNKAAKNVNKADALTPQEHFQFFKISFVISLLQAAIRRTGGILTYVCVFPSVVRRRVGTPLRSSHRLCPPLPGGNGCSGSLVPYGFCSAWRRLRQKASRSVRLALLFFPFPTLNDRTAARPSESLKHWNGLMSSECL